MKLNINITNKSKEKNIHQFIFFTEEHWEKNKTDYSPLLKNFFNGKKNEFYSIADDKIIIYLIGLGKENPELCDIQAIAKKFAYSYKDKFITGTYQIISEFDTLQLTYLFEGLYSGTYQYPFEAEHPFWDKKWEWLAEDFSPKDLAEIATSTIALCRGQFAGMDWLNKPANQKKVSQISKYLIDIAKKHNLSYTSYDREECKKLGLGAFLAVNQGSSQEAAFTILEYKSPVKNAPTVGLVGKCVLFDTGGISIKPATNMHYMKSDMGGATAVIGTLIAASEMKLPVNLVAILPITDNAVSSAAYLPSDVVTAYNGKTIEVIDTDAEGRMTLADGLAYLSKNYKTDALIDLATLTGSSVRMFGYTCGALFSNNNSLKNQLEEAGNITHQRLWNLPLWEDWAEEISSDVADYKNISFKPFGDCIVAAKFLEQFIENHPSWAHLDIAGVAFGNVDYAKDKAATGYGVQLLIQFLTNFKK